MSGAADNSGLSVLIRADASARIGGGHVMRCLSLADELAARGVRVSFACASVPDFFAARIKRAGHGLHRVERIGELLVEEEDWDSAILSAAAQRHDADLVRATVGDTDWVVLDHYRLDGSWLEAAAPDARRLVIDDLANRPQLCDILVDQTFGRRASDYSALVPQACRLLIGADYALLRPEFAQARPAALHRRRDAAKVERLLISLGSTDIGGITREALESVVAAGVECRIDVVLGAAAPSLAAVQALASGNSRISLHVDSSDMAALTAAADLAVGAPGTSSWERCCLGLPSVTLVIAENQRLVSRMLAEAGTVAPVESAAGIGAAVARLVADQRARAKMSAAAAAITTGSGAGLVADAMLRQDSAGERSPLALRPGGEADSETLWLWRNDPVVRAMSKNGDAIPWSDHQRWFSAMLEAGRSRLFMADIEDAPAAMVRFDREEAEAVVSINVSSHMRGRGVGRPALIAACEAYRAESPGTRLVADIRGGNEASVRVFLAAGFEATGGTADGFRRFIRADGATMGGGGRG